MRKTVTKWVVSVVVLPAIVLALQKRIFKYIDEHM
jgi:hypothetical protein